MQQVAHPAVQYENNPCDDAMSLYLFKSRVPELQQIAPEQRRQVYSVAVKRFWKDKRLYQWISAACFLVVAEVAQYLGWRIFFAPNAPAKAWIPDFWKRDIVWHGADIFVFLLAGVGWIIWQNAGVRPYLKEQIQGNQQ